MSSSKVWLMLRFWVLVVMCFHVGHGQVCPFSWVDGGVVSDRCYLLQSTATRYKFDEANTKCQSYGGQLLVISSQAERDWLLKQLQQITSAFRNIKSWWVGIQYVQGQYVWVDDTPVNDDLLPWSPDVAANSTGPCVAIKGQVAVPVECNTWLNIICTRNKSIPLKCDVDSQWHDINGSCFKTFLDQRTWGDAKTLCEMENGRLATVATFEEHSQLWDVARNSSPATTLWTGLHVTPDTSSGQLQLAWLDGPLSDSVKTYWKDGTDLNALQPGTSMAIDGSIPRRLKSWSLEKDTSLHGFACQRPQGVCESGWLTHQSTCFKFYDRNVRWTEANSFCIDLGGQLVNLASASDQLFVQRYLPEFAAMGQRSFWIGISDNGNDYGPLVWTDGKQIGSASHWAQDPPPSNTAGARDCGFISTSDSEGRWQMTSDCLQPRGFLCTIPVNVPVREVPATTTASGLLCEVGWIRSNHKCYHFTDRLQTWQQSQSFCVMLGAHLAIIRDQTDQAFMDGHISGADYWMGLSDLQNEGRWRWVDNSTVSGFLNWAPREPNSLGGEEDCGTMWGTRGESLLGQWNDKHCNTKQQSVCEKKPLISQTTPSMDSTTTTSTTTAVVYSAKCGPNWEERPNSDLCYQFHDDVKSHADALNFCNNQFGSLVSITDHAEQSYLAGRTQSISVGIVWTGATDSEVEGGWKWADGSPFTYINWNAGKPDNKDSAHCAAMLVKSSHWTDLPCRFALGFICKKFATTHTYATRPNTTPLPPGKFWSCPRGYIGYHGSCYVTHTTLKTWADAQRSCRTEGGDLATVADRQENDFLLSMLPQEICSNVHGVGDVCRRWAEQGECEKNPVWMGRNCQQACRQCHRVCSDRHTHLQCQFWASNGECQKNPVWMMVNCALSCQACDRDLNNLTGSWIGLNELGIKGSFTWSDNGRVSFSNWHTGMPMILPQRSCVLITKTKGGSWVNAPCGGVAKYVCQRPMNIDTVTSLSPFRVGCPPSSMGYGSSCYIPVTTPMTQAQAQQFCSRPHGNLATINSLAVQSFVVSQLDLSAGQHYWIGLSDTATPGTYTWVSGDKVRFTAWNSNHTGAERAMCVGVQTGHPVGLWQSLDCGALRPFVCQYPRKGYTTPTIPTTSTTPAPTTSLPCPDGWSGFQDTCYKAITEKSSLKSWSDAKVICRGYGGDLASIHNDHVHTFFSHTLLSGVAYTGGNYWIGLTDADVESTYVWSDGSPVDYMKWSPGEPNNAGGNEDCGEYNTYTDAWNDNSCYIVNAFICALPRAAPLRTTLFPITTTPVPTCDGTDWLAKSGHCYYVSPLFGQDSTKTWFEARRFCQRNGADLASIDSQDVNSFLVEYTTRQQATLRPYWIGFNKLGRTTYEWTDKSPVVFTSWSSSEPNDAYGGQMCANMYSMSGDWNDDNCNEEFHFICKRGNGTITPRPPFPTPLIQGGCPPKFSGVGNKCFHVGGLNASEALNYTAARDTCRAMTSRHPVDIASISNHQQQAFVMSLLEGSRSAAFLGLNDMHVNGKFVWQNNEEVTVTYWAPNQPSEKWTSFGIAKEDCVVMKVEEQHFGLWEDTYCGTPHAYVCQTMKDEHYPRTSPERGICKVDHVYYRDSCYGTYKMAQTWLQAERTCVRDLGHLVSLRDIHELAQVSLFVYDDVIIKPVWIGLSVDQRTQEYRWVDGWPVQLTSWAEGEPDRVGSNRSCVTMHSGQWNDTSCDELHPFVCKMSSVTPPPTTAPPPGYCKNNTWTPYGANCYFADPTNKKSWPEADYLCSQRGMQLLSVHDEDEVNFVKSLVSLAVTTPRSSYTAPDTRVWLGLQRTVDGGFRWSDNSPFDYYSWNSGEPNNMNNEEQCAELLVTSGKWNDIACISANAMGERGFVCKAPKIIPTTTTTTTTTTTSTTTTTTTYASSTASTSGRQTTQSDGRTAKSTGSSGGATLSGGEIAGIVIGLLVLFVVVGAVVYVVRRYREIASSHPRGEPASGFENALFTRGDNKEEVALSSKDDVSAHVTNGSNLVSVELHPGEGNEC